MITEKITYVCAACGTEFISKDDAKECEAEHQKFFDGVESGEIQFSYLFSKGHRTPKKVIICYSEEKSIPWHLPTTNSWQDEYVYKS